MISFTAEWTNELYIGIITKSYNIGTCFHLIDTLWRKLWCWCRGFHYQTFWSTRFSIFPKNRSLVLTNTARTAKRCITDWVVLTTPFLTMGFACWKSHSWWTFYPITFRWLELIKNRDKTIFDWFFFWLSCYRIFHWTGIYTCAIW